MPSLGLHLCSIYVSVLALILLMALEDVFLAKNTLGRETLDVVAAAEQWVAERTRAEGK